MIHNDRPLRFEKKDYPRGRCNPCRHAREVETTGQWSFLGCYHPPYHGKWVAEIKECPRCAGEIGGKR